MTAQLCPYLGTGDEEDRGPAQTYPSFENRCFAQTQIPSELDGLEGGSTLLLRDQATYCLGATHNLCPRYRALHGAAAPPEPLAQAVEPFSDPLGPNAQLWEDMDDRPRRLGFWVSLLATLVVLLFCGGSVAAYMGWQLIGRTLNPPQRLASQDIPTPPPGPVFLLVTATAAVEPDAPVAAPAVIVTPTPTFAFPQAVTPTPRPTDSGNPIPLPPVVEPAGPIVITTPTPASPEPVAPDLATAVALPVVITTPGSLPPTPTRRPTPTPGAGDLPVGPPGAVIVVTATPTPDLPEPVVTFRAAHQSVLPGDCTILSWDVENARAVFLDNEGVAGHGERRVCLRWESQTFVLSVLSLDGVETLHRLTVQLVPHTPTPTITPTMTPVFTPTPTWTPEGGSPANPAPPRIAVSLVVDGGNQITCTPGQQCEAVLQVRNDGDLADEIFVNLSKDGPWPAQICRSDGICGDSVVSQGVGTGQQIPVFVRVTPPVEAANQAFTFRVEAVSGNSGHTVASGPSFVTFRVGN